MRIIFLLGLMVCVAQAENSVLLQLLAKFRIGDCHGDCPCDDSDNKLEAAQAKLSALKHEVDGLQNNLNEASAANSSVNNAQSAVDELKEGLNSSSNPGGRRLRFRRGTNTVNFKSCEDSTQSLQGQVGDVTRTVLNGLMDAMQTVSSDYKVTKLNCYTDLAQQLAAGLLNRTYNAPSDVEALLTLANNVSSKTSEANSALANAIASLKVTLEKKKAELETQKAAVENLGGTVPVTTTGAPTTPSPECPPGGGKIPPSMTNATFVCSTSVGETTSTSSSENVLSSAATTESTRASCPGQTLFGENCWSPGLANPRIVGGTAAEADEYPYQVYLDIDDISCGGSILSSKWILTAAHCLYSHINSKRAQNITIYANTIIRNEGTEVQPSRLIIHPGYECTAVYNDLMNDIALLELCEPLDLNLPGIKPICFLKEDTNYTGPVTATGWGDMQEGSKKGSDTLQEVVLDLISEEQCLEKQGEIVNPLNGSYVCTLTTGKDACQGDSGGPLVGEVSEGCWVQLGIVSYSDGCAREGNPEIYMKVSYYRDWICEVTKLCG